MYTRKLQCSTLNSHAYVSQRDLNSMAQRMECARFVCCVLRRSARTTKEWTFGAARTSRSRSASGCAAACSSSCRAATSDTSSALRTPTRSPVRARCRVRVRVRVHPLVHLLPLLPRLQRYCTHSNLSTSPATSLHTVQYECTCTLCTGLGGCDLRVQLYMATRISFLLSRVAPLLSPSRTLSASNAFPSLFRLSSLHTAPFHLFCLRTR